MRSYLAPICGSGDKTSVFEPRFDDGSGGLVDVFHETAPLKDMDAEMWRVVMRARMGSTRPTDRSGVWRYREWVMPELDEKDMICAGEGNAPLVDAGRLTAEIGVKDLRIKQCGHALTGSFKDLGMTVLVSMAAAMRERGKSISALLCASTGDTSAALAAYGARADIPVVVLLPAGKITPAQLVQPLAHGAHVFALDGDFDACMKVVQELTQQEGMFLANSKNPLRLEGQKTVAFEIAQDLGWDVPDVIAIPSGNLGNVSALYKGFSLLLELRMIERMPQLVAAQVDSANPLFKAWQSDAKELSPMTAQATQASAIRIGDPVSWPRAKKALEGSNGTVTSASEDEVAQMSARADRAGLFVCPHTAAALVGVEQLRESNSIAADARVVVVSTAHGLKFAGQKARFHAGEQPVDGVTLDAGVDAFRNPIHECPSDASAVAKTLGELLS